MKIYFTNAGLRKRSFAKVINGALDFLGQPESKLEMSLSVVSQDEIKSLNKQYRNVDAVTDVLSFPTLDNPERKVLNVSDYNLDSVNPLTGRLNIGDVIICLDRAKEQAESYNHSLKRELCFLALHGLLHLLGYDHAEQADEEQMTELQEEILNKLKIFRK